MFRIVSICMVLVFSFISLSFAQWNSEFSSNQTSSSNASGWTAFEQAGDNYNYRFYIVDGTSFNIMQSQYSNIVEYSYTFTAEEIQAGNQIYSVGHDLTGDGYVEYYVLAYHGTGEPYRQSFKIVDVVNNSIIFQRDDAGFHFTYPVIWDVDDDGTLEASFAKYDYPDYANVNYEVYNTGVTTNFNSGKPELDDFTLEQNYPNPFNPVTKIDYLIPEASNVKIDVYNVKGELIKTLVDKQQNSGKHSVKWDATNNAGNKVSSGTYFYQIKADDNVSAKKMIFIK